MTITNVRNRTAMEIAATRGHRKGTVLFEILYLSNVHMSVYQLSESLLSTKRLFNLHFDISEKENKP